MEKRKLINPNMNSSSADESSDEGVLETRVTSNDVDDADDMDDVDDADLMHRVDDVDEVEDEVDEVDDDDEKPFVSTVLLPHQALEVDFIVLKEEDFVTTDMLSLFEMTSLVTIRINQISRTGTAFVDIIMGETATTIAKRELMQRKCPLMIEREIGTREVDGKIYRCVEHRDPNTMIFAGNYDV